MYPVCTKCGHKLRVIFCAGILLVCGMTLPAPVVGELLPITVFDEIEGVPNVPITRILHDSGGFLWIASAGGGISHVFFAHNDEPAEGTWAATDGTRRVFRPPPGREWTGHPYGRLSAIDGQRAILREELGHFGRILTAPRSRILCREVVHISGISTFRVARRSQTSQRNRDCESRPSHRQPR